MEFLDWLVGYLMYFVLAFNFVVIASVHSVRLYIPSKRDPKPPSGWLSKIAALVLMWLTSGLAIFGLRAFVRWLNVFPQVIASDADSAMRYGALSALGLMVFGLCGTWIVARFWKKPKQAEPSEP